MQGCQTGHIFYGKLGFGQWCPPLPVASESSLETYAVDPVTGEGSIRLFDIRPCTPIPSVRYTLYVVAFSMVHAVVGASDPATGTCGGVDQYVTLSATKTVFCGQYAGDSYEAYHDGDENTVE